MTAHRLRRRYWAFAFMSLSAFDFGYFGHLELYARLQNCFDGMKGLERYHGHFLNWYDTKSLAPLNPRYVSSVDSGVCEHYDCGQAQKDVRKNLLFTVIFWIVLTCYLIVVALLLCPKTANLEKAIIGLMEKLRLVDETSLAFSVQLKEIFVDERIKIEECLANLVKKSTKQIEINALQKLSTWADRCMHHMLRLQSDIEHYIPWVFLCGDMPEGLEGTESETENASLWLQLKKALPLNPAFEAIPEITANATKLLDEGLAFIQTEKEDIVDWFKTLTKVVKESHTNSKNLIADFREFSKEADILVNEMDFSFFNKQRKVFTLIQSRFWANG